MRLLGMALALTSVSYLAHMPSASASEQDIEFFYENNCRGGIAFTMNSHYPTKGSCKSRRPICKNDTARSVYIRRNVKLPLTIVLHDDPDGGFSNDDYTSINIWKPGQSMRTGPGVCLGSFEQVYGKTWMSMNWSRGNGIDGKVSYIKMGRN